MCKSDLVDCPFDWYVCPVALLYAVGGYDGASRHCLSTVECYNPDTDTWTPVAEMSCRRSGAGMLVSTLTGVVS